MKTSLAVLIIALGFSLPSLAQLLVYEPFDYVTGDLAANSDWIDNGTSRGADVVSGSMSYTDSQGNILVTAGNSVSTTGSRGQGYTLDLTATNSILSNPFGGVNETGSVWISILFNSAGSSGYDGLGIYTNNGSGAATQTRDFSLLGTGNFGGTAQGFITTNASTAVNAVGVTNFLVAELSYNGAGQGDALNVWVNPLLDGASPMVDPGNPNSVMTSGFIGGGVNQLEFYDLLEIVHDNTDLEGTMLDEIRVGRSYSDVSPFIPEPSAAALFGIVALMCVARRRR